MTRPRREDVNGNIALMLRTRRSTQPGKSSSDQPDDFMRYRREHLYDLLNQANMLRTRRSPITPHNDIMLRTRKADNQDDYAIYNMLKTRKSQLDSIIPAEEIKEI